MFKRIPTAIEQHGLPKACNGDIVQIQKDFYITAAIFCTSFPASSNTTVGTYYCHYCCCYYYYYHHYTNSLYVY